jgi:hypothetical protein
MVIKRGIVVNHAGALEWGAGKILEVTALKATIQFSDGVIRKIASSHFTTLQAADVSSYVPLLDKMPADKAKAAPRKPRKLKQPTA